MTEYRLRTEVGSLLRLRRQAAGLSQDMLARQVGATQSVISRVERGMTASSLDLVERLFAAIHLQLRVSAERLDAHIDAEIERLSATPVDERLSPWDWAIRDLGKLEIVFEGPLAALLQGVPVPVDAVDIALPSRALDDFTAWLRWRGPLRWSERWQEFRLMNSDPREPGALHWRLATYQLRARLCRELPDALTVCHRGTSYRVTPLARLELTDPLLAGVLRRYREVGVARDPGGVSGPPARSPTSVAPG